MKNESASTAVSRPAAQPKGKPVGAVVNAAKILRFLRAAQGPATVTQVARAVRANPSTCFNILRTLTREDFVQFDDTAKTYQLSLGLVALARGALEHSTELQLLEPRIARLAQEHRMMVAIWRKISEDRIMLVAAAESDAPIRIHARVGARSPSLLGASGRVFTAFSRLPRAKLRERFQRLRLSRPLAFETYLRQLDEVRRTGWALDDGYTYAGTVTIAAPVLEPGGTLRYTCAAILFNGQYDRHRLGRIAEELRAVGRTLLEAAPAAVEAGAETGEAGAEARASAPDPVRARTTRRANAKAASPTTAKKPRGPGAKKPQGPGVKKPRGPGVKKPRGPGAKKPSSRTRG